MKNFIKNTFSRLFSIILIIIFFIIFILILIPKQKEIIVKKNSILKINLDKSILDRTSGNPLPSIDGLNISSTDNIELKEILDNIDKAKFDKKISVYRIVDPYMAKSMSHWVVMSVLNYIRNTFDYHSQQKYKIYL